MTATPCPNAANHTEPAPGEDWPAFARRMGATHLQQACGGCGQWVVWAPRPRGRVGTCAECGSQQPLRSGAVGPHTVARIGPGGVERTTGEPCPGGGRRPEDPEAAGEVA